MRVSNPFSGERERLGYFDCLESAERKYNKRKYEIASDWAERIEDKRLKDALLKMKNERFKI